MTVLIEGLETECSSRYRFGLQLGKGATEAFPYLQSENPTSNAYSEPMACFDSTLSWCWMEWHRSGDMKLIARTIGSLVERVREINRLAVNDGLRRLHDIFMLQAAVLSGDNHVMQEAANLAGQYDPSSGRHAYEWGLVGVYKGSIINDPKYLRKSFDLMMTSRPSPPYRMPSKTVVEAFVIKDAKKLARTLKSLWKREWDTLAKQKGILERSEDRVRITLRPRGPNDMWPWPEVAIAKLAVMNGAEIPVDPLWCPKEFLHSSPTNGG